MLVAEQTTRDRFPLKRVFHPFFFYFSLTEQGFCVLAIVKNCIMTYLHKGLVQGWPVMVLEGRCGCRPLFQPSNNTPDSTNEGP